MHRNELDKACFAHFAVYCDGKDLTRRTISGKILKDRGYETARNFNYDGHQRELQVWLTSFLISNHNHE